MTGDELRRPAPAGFTAAHVDGALLAKGFALALDEAGEVELLEEGRQGRLTAVLEPWDAEGWSTARLVRVGSGASTGYATQVHWSMVAAK